MRTSGLRPQQRRGGGDWQGARGSEVERKQTKPKHTKDTDLRSEDKMKGSRGQ